MRFHGHAPSVFAAALLACGGCGDSPGAAPADRGAAAPDEKQLPPTGEAALDAWLARGLHRAWHCEPAMHAARAPSPHGMNRICSNDLLSGWSGAGPFPVFAASVKELGDESGALRGYAVSRHAAAGAGGETWYWFEKDRGALFADGLGDAGAPRAICVSCHQGAGPPRTGHDFVYTQVR